MVIFDQDIKGIGIPLPGHTSGMGSITLKCNILLLLLLLHYVIPITYYMSITFAEVIYNITITFVKVIYVLYYLLHFRATKSETCV